MTLEQAQIEEAAAFLLHLRVQRQSVATFPPEIAPRDLDDAYAIQDAIHDTAGWPISLLKVGGTSTVAQQAVGLSHPIGGRIPADAVFGSGEQIPAPFFGAPPMIECEIALQVGDAGEVLAVAPALELVERRVGGTGTSGGLALIADNSGGCAVVIGEPKPIGELDKIGEIGGSSRLDDILEEIDIELRGGDLSLATGRVAAVIGGPTGSTQWSLAHESSRGRTVSPGTWIITGTCTGITPSTFGETYQASFGHLGSVSYSTS